MYLVSSLLGRNEREFFLNSTKHSGMSSYVHHWLWQSKTRQFSYTSCLCFGVTVCLNGIKGFAFVVNIKVLNAVRITVSLQNVTFTCLKFVLCWCALLVEYLGTAFSIKMHSCLAGQEILFYQEWQQFVRCEFLASVFMNIQVYWDITSRRTWRCKPFTGISLPFSQNPRKVPHHYYSESRPLTRILLLDHLSVFSCMA